MDDTVTLTPAQRSFVKEYLADFSLRHWSVELAGQAASQRYFVRLARRQQAERSYILVVWDGKDEDWPRFIALSFELSPLAPFFPAVYAADARRGLILEEDLGTLTLKRYATEQRGDKGLLSAAYSRVIDALCQWQGLDVKSSATVASRALDEEVFLWETDYFARRCVVDFCGCEHALGRRWEEERTRLASAAASLPKTFVHRDFQSENIMLTDRGVRLVDFQGARQGPPGYDLASLLYDPYVSALDEAFCSPLFEYYRSRALKVSVDQHGFDLCAAQRLMQALGAYGNLSIHKGKPWYREFVPVALKRLQGVLVRLPEYPVAKAIVDRCIEAVEG